MINMNFRVLQKIPQKCLLVNFAYYMTFMQKFHEVENKNFV